MPVPPRPGWWYFRLFAGRLSGLVGRGVGRREDDPNGSPGSLRTRGHCTANRFAVQSISRPVYDVTGAGDTVIAVMALAYSCGASLRESAELANLAAGRVVLKFGTAGITAGELLEAVRRRG